MSAIDSDGLTMIGLRHMNRLLIRSSDLKRDISLELGIAINRYLKSQPSVDLSLWVTSFCQIGGTISSVSTSGARIRARILDWSCNFVSLWRFKHATWMFWKDNKNGTACFGKDCFDFGIYQLAVNLTTHRSIATRYNYGLFLGFQQISTLVGSQMPSQMPSYFVWGVLFTMAIIRIGLLLFALLIGNIQSFLQALGRRNMSNTKKASTEIQFLDLVGTKSAGC